MYDLHVLFGRYLERICNALERSNDLTVHLISLHETTFAQREPEALAGILGAGVSAPGEGEQPSPKTHASPARSAQSNPVEE